MIGLVIEEMRKIVSRRVGAAADRLKGDRIVQEALTNVAKHSGAQRVSVSITRKDGAFTAVIEDDGGGFEAGGTDGAGLGLVGMKERLGPMNGRFLIESTEGAGTTIVGEVPLR